MHRGHSGMFVTDVIVELGYATRERVDEVVNEARGAGKPPEALLREHKVIDGDQLSRAIAERYGLDHLDLSRYEVDMGATSLLSVAAARRYKSIPVGYVDKETLVLAMGDPANVLAVDDIQMMTGLNCQVAVAAEEDIEALIGRMNSLESAVSEAVSEEEDLEGEAEVTEMHESADDAPVIKLVYSVLAQAVSRGRLRRPLRGGRGRDEGPLPGRRSAARDRAGAEADDLRGGLAHQADGRHGHRPEKRVPQDGRVGVNVEDRKVDLRVTTLPTQRGEGCTIRILDKDKAMRTLDELGMGGRAGRSSRPLSRSPTARSW